MDNVNLFTCTSVQHHFPVRWCSCRLIVTWVVLLVAHLLLTLPEHIISPPGFSAHWFVFCVVFCRSFSVLLSLFFRPLYWLSIFNVSFPIIPLVSDLNSNIKDLSFYQSLKVVLSTPTLTQWHGMWISKQIYHNNNYALMIFSNRRFDLNVSCVGILWNIVHCSQAFWPHEHK